MEAIQTINLTKRYKDLVAVDQLNLTIMQGELFSLLGINGAALASLLTQIFTNVGLGYIIKPIRRNNTLMLRGLNPGLIKHMLSARNRRSR